jgi:hypothetical protein
MAFIYARLVIPASSTKRMADIYCGNPQHMPAA